MKRSNMVRVTSEDLEKIPRQTDWTRFDEMSEEELERNALEDPDTPPWPGEDLENVEYSLGRIRPKLAVSIRLDADILDYFKQQGRGYQSRINAVLRAFVEAQAAKSKSVKTKKSNSRRGAAKKSK